MKPTLETHFKKMKAEADSRRVAAIEEAKARIEAEYLADIRGIERLESYSQAAEGNGSVVPESSPIDQVVRPKRDKVGPAAATREAITALPDGFTTRDVKDYIAKHHPNAKIATPSIFSAMNKFKETGEIEVLKQNSGREPGTYKKAKMRAVQGFFEEKAVNPKD